MKTNITKSIIFLSLVAFFISCSNTEEDLFDESAPLRLEKSKNQYQNILESSKQGWILQYFPHPEQTLGGVNYYLNFKDGNVTAKIEGIEDEKTSMYSILNRGGNILSFNSYNPILHLYANPSSPNPQGAGGDFEFLILDQKDNVINLKGTRTGNLMRLIKIDNKFDGYKEKVENVRKYLNKLYFPLKGTINGKETTFEYSSEKNITFIYNGTENINFSYINTDKGISFYEPIIVDGKEYTELIFKEGEKKLVSEDGKINIDLRYILINFEVTTWELDIAIEENRSARIKTAWDGDNLLNGLVLGGKYNLKTNYIIGNSRGKVGIFSYVTEVASGNTLSIGGYKFDFKSDENDYKTINISKNKPYALDWYYGYVSNINDIITQNSPYTMEVDNEDNPRKVKLISKAKPEIWFVLTR